MSVDPLSVECPYCGASVGQRCIVVPSEPYPLSIPERKPHAARVRAAERKGGDRGK